MEIKTIAQDEQWRKEVNESLSNFLQEANEFQKTLDSSSECIKKIENELLEYGCNFKYVLDWRDDIYFTYTTMGSNDCNNEKTGFLYLVDNSGKEVKEVSLLRASLETRNIYFKRLPEFLDAFKNHVKWKNHGK